MVTCLRVIVRDTLDAVDAVSQGEGHREIPYFSQGETKAQETKC